MAETTEPGAAGPPAGRPEIGGGFTGPQVEEKGATVDGVPQTLDARTFVQLQAFTGVLDPAPAVEAIRRSELDAVLYADVNDPRGLAVVLMSEDPAAFVGPGRALLTRPPFDAYTPVPALTMIGRTYASGREKDLRDWLLLHARRQALNPNNVWGVWYPLRRIGAFNRLPRPEQLKMLGEHAMIGRAYGEAGHANDIRLECHGLDRDDNEFVIGLVGPKLHPLSKLVKDMRPTRQTSEYIEKMGPFFVGKVLYQSPLPETARRRSGQHSP
jgi:chlorite dismutase